MAATLPTYLFTDCNSAQLSPTNTAYAWANEVSLESYPAPAGAPTPGTWVTLWSTNSGAFYTFVSNLCIAEAAL